MPNQYLPGVITAPVSLLILIMTRANPLVITAVVPSTGLQSNTYVVGMAIRLFVPWTYGMWQANSLICTITNIRIATFINFTVDVNSSGFDAFVIPSASKESPASLAPAGSRNLEYDNLTINYLPFHSLNNIGN
jgi:hypothetical protein